MKKNGISNRWKFPIVAISGLVSLISGIFTIMSLMLASKYVWPISWVGAVIMKILEVPALLDISWMFVGLLGPIMLGVGLLSGAIGGFIAIVSGAITAAALEMK